MTVTTKRHKSKRTTPLVFNLMVMPCPSHTNPAGWAQPGDTTTHFPETDHWVELAKLAEDMKFNSVFIADVLGPYDVYNGPHNFDACARRGAQFPSVDPSVYVSAMAQATKNVGFGVTFSTMYEHPYHFGRKIASLDHSTKGRIGWNIVTSYLESAARNLLDGNSLPPRDKRYQRAHEYIEAIYELLLSSWRDDAVVIDKENFIYAEPTRIREINFKSDNFNIPGPFLVQPSPQRLPLLLQAGGSQQGLEFAAKHGEVLFIEDNFEVAKKFIGTISELATKKYGRKREHLKFIVGLHVIVEPTHEEAEAKFQETLKYHSEEGKKALLGGWTGIDVSKVDESDSEAVKTASVETKTNLLFKDGVKKDITQDIGIGLGRKRLVLGTPEEVADTLEKYVDECGVNGFNFIAPHFPYSYHSVKKYLVPELQKRGLLWEDYAVEGGTLRENIYGVKGQTFVPEDHVAYNYRWTKDVEKSQFSENLLKYKKELKLKD